ncbi:MAG: hypothetical protein QOJ27_616 [Sphingomonadales bacterium]|nr:hypothetical protein [Sphingomonadales bacterium]
MALGVKSSSASLAFAALLLVTLAAKAMSSAPTPAPDPRRFAAAAAGMLQARGFATAFEPRPLGILIYARRGGCRLMAGDYTPYGTFAEVFAGRARPFGPLRFVYRGVAYDRAPKLVPLTDFYVWRERRRLGIAALRHPIVAVAGTSGCELAGLDWSRLAALPD